MKDNIIEDTIKIPIVPLRGLTVFPHMIIGFDAAREMSIEALKSADRENERIVFLTTQIDEKIENPNFADIYKVGTIAEIQSIEELPGKQIRVLVKGIERGRLESIEFNDEYYIGEINVFTDKYAENDLEM